jgi:hypothetical protein
MSAKEIIPKDEAAQSEETAYREVLADTDKDIAEIKVQMKTAGRHDQNYANALGDRLKLLKGARQELIEEARKKNIKI